jgi:hypothetical protein
MIGFEFPCGTNVKPPNANPLWPRPGMTGLSHKGMEIIAGKPVKYAEQSEWYKPETGTYKYEWFASKPEHFYGAVGKHEGGHMLGLPHPQDDPACNGMDYGQTTMYAWWESRGLLPPEIAKVRANPMMR